MELGQVGYEAYAQSTGGKTYDGRPMPTWAEVKERTPHVAKAWNDAAREVTVHGYVGAPSSVAADGVRELGGFGFGYAITLMKAGLKVARAGWNGKKMWIALTTGSTILPETARAGAAEHLAAEMQRAEERGEDSIETIRIGAHIDMRAADGSLVVGWLASQTDMLAEDWMVVE